MSGLHEDPSVHVLPATPAEALSVLGPARDPAAPLHRVETVGPPVLEVATLWQDTVLDVRHLAAGRALTLGVGADLDLPAADLPAPQLALFVVEGDRTLARLCPRWAGWRERGGRREPLAEVMAAAPEVEPGVREVEVQPGDQLLVEVGPVGLLARLAAPGARVAGRVSTEVDVPFVGIMSSAIALAALLSVAISAAPPPVQESVVAIPDRFAEVFLAAQEPPAQPRAEVSTRPDAGEGKRRAGEEGKAGRERGKRQASGQRADRRQLDREIAEDAGVLGFLADAGELGGVFDAGVNHDLRAGIGGLHAAVGVQMGTGYGDVNRGPGGGGTEIGSFTGAGTRGRGDGSSGDFAGGGELGPKRDGGVRPQGEPIVIGGLDRSLIDAAVKRHLSQIRYCYQRQLARDPSLQGKITVQFTIASDGAVSRSRIKSSSMGSAEVEGCISDRFLRMQFPQPSGGGIVIVSYPFMFSPG